VVFISSVAALSGLAANSLYSARKGGIVALTRSLAVELAREGFRVNCVSPGHVSTQMARDWCATLNDEQIAALHAAHPLGLGAPADVAHAIAFLLAKTGRWITGTNLVVDGGYTAQ
jgi:NAD(P)-dependent dehydrogenase (short-subunit alcohol dehydrogenase family)